MEMTGLKLQTQPTANTAFSTALPPDIVRDLTCMQCVFTVSRSYSGLPWEGVSPTPVQPECDSHGNCMLRTNTSAVYRIDVVNRGQYCVRLSLCCVD